MRFPIERKIQVSFALVIALVSAIGIVSYRNTRNIVRNSRRLLARTRDVLAEMQATRSAIADAQSEIRGFRLSGDAVPLNRYEVAMSRAQGHISRLKELSAGNGRQQARMSLLEQKVNECFKSNEAIVRVWRARRPKSRSMRVDAAGARAATAEIQLILSELAEEENDVLTRQAENSELTASSTILAMMVLVTVALVLLSAAYYLIRRYVSEHQRAEKALRESRERYRELFENASDIVFTLDMEGNFTSVNKAAEEITGYKRDDASPLSFSQVIAPEYVDLAQEMLKRKLNGGRPTRYELEIVTRNGRRVPLEVSTRLLLRDGKPTGVQGIARDITDRKRAEEALREGELRFRTLFEEAPVAYHEIDAQGIVRRVNRAECNLLGFGPSEILGRPIWEFVARERREVSQEAVLRKLTGQQALIPFQREYTRRDGAHLILEIHENLMRDKNGVVVGIRSALLDVTERKLAERELEARTMESILLSELGSLLQTCSNADEAYGVIAEIARKLFPGASGAICALSASRNLAECVATWGNSLMGQQVFAPDACWALRSGRSHFVGDATSPLVCRHLSQSPPAASFCVPMMAQGDALGVLHVQVQGTTGDSRGTPPGALTNSKQRLAITLAEQIGLALANLRLRETLRVQSIRDPLTGLFNRRYMEESLERELRRAARNHGSLGAIMLDLDHFKQYNDTFGHDAGDCLLRELGNFLQTQFRGEDIACRFGGEEFILILPEASLEATQQRAEQVREGIKHLHVLHRGRPLGTVTGSLGAVVFPSDGTTAEALIRAADEALYRAKSLGRDRVVVGRPAKEQPTLVP